MIQFVQDETKSKRNTESQSIEDIPIPFNLTSSDCGFEVNAVLSKDFRVTKFPTVF